MTARVALRVAERFLCSFSLRGSPTDSEVLDRTMCRRKQSRCVLRSAGRGDCAGAASSETFAASRPKVQKVLSKTSKTIILYIKFENTFVTFRSAGDNRIAGIGKMRLSACRSVFMKKRGYASLSRSGVRAHCRARVSWAACASEKLDEFVVHEIARSQEVADAVFLHQRRRAHVLSV